MKLTGKTQAQIDAETLERETAKALDEAHEEVENELYDILRSIAIEKYIEKQKVVNAEAGNTVL